MVAPGQKAIFPILKTTNFLLFFFIVQENTHFLLFFYRKKNFQDRGANLILILPWKLYYGYM